MNKPRTNKTKAGLLDGIRARLRWWYEKRKRESPDRYGNYQRAARTLGFNRPTLRGWLERTKKGKKPLLPNLAALVELIDKEGLNPAWLLLGTGPEFLTSDVQQTELAAQLRAVLLDEVQREWKLDRALVEKVVPSGDELLTFASVSFRERIGGFIIKYLQAPPEIKAQLEARLGSRPVSLTPESPGKGPGRRSSSTERA